MQLRFIFVVLCFTFAAEAMLLTPHVCDPVPPGNKYVQGEISVEPESSLGATGVLYGYYYDTTAQTSNLYAINPTTGATQPVCTIKSTYPLVSSSQATMTQQGLLLFTTQDPGTTNTKGYLVTINPKTCALSMIAVDQQQKQANFIKYDNTKGNLYMAFQNPFCIHSSLYQVDPTNGKLIRKLGNVVAGEDSADHIGMDVASQGFYYTYEDYTGFYLSRVDLKTGNITNAPLNFKPIGGGAQWIYNTFTLSYVPSPSTWGSGIVTGIANFNNASSPCHPVGVFGIVPDTKVSMVCLQKLPTASTVTLATDEAPGLGYLYQLVDGGTLLTYDAINKHIVTSVSCAKCSTFTSLAYLSAPSNIIN